MVSLRIRATGGHDVEGFGQMADFIGFFYGCRDSIIAFADLLGGMGKFGKLCRYAAGEYRTGKHGNGDHNQGDDDHKPQRFARGLKCFGLILFRKKVNPQVRKTMIDANHGLSPVIDILAGSAVMHGQTLLDAFIINMNIRLFRKA